MIKKEKDDIYSYLELDNDIFEDNSNVLYYNNTIYILHYPGNKIASVSYGLLNKNEGINYLKLMQISISSFCILYLHIISFFNLFSFILDINSSIGYFKNEPLL